MVACVYFKPDGSKQAEGEDTNTFFSEGLNLVELLRTACLLLVPRSGRVRSFS